MPSHEHRSNRRRASREPRRHLYSDRPAERFAPLVRHYPVADIARISHATVPDLEIAALFHQGDPAPQKFGWQPEEDSILGKYPDPVVAKLLPWRTVEAVRSRRRDLGRRAISASVALLKILERRRKL